MANKQRGEVELKAGGEAFILCLTLGALAEIESTFGIEDMTEIGKVFEKPKASQFVALLHALLVGGSEAEGANPRQKGITIETVRGMQIDLKSALQAVKDTFGATNMADEPPAGEAAPGGDTDAAAAVTPAT